MSQRLYKIGFITLDNVSGYWNTTLARLHMVQYDKGEIQEQFCVIFGKGIERRRMKMQDMYMSGLYYIVHIESGGWDNEVGFALQGFLLESTCYLTTIRRHQKRNIQNNTRYY